MKTRFLDIRNCRSLMPNADSKSVLLSIDNTLSELNDNHPDIPGHIDKLVSRNDRTIESKVGFSRLLPSPLRVAQYVHVESGWINLKSALSPLPGPANLESHQAYGETLGWKTVIPLQFLLKGWGDASRGHQCYVHTISRNLVGMHDIDAQIARQFSNTDDHYYVGITSRHWLKRLKEHLGEIRRGSNKHFHREWRRAMEEEGVLFSSHLRDINRSYEDAMDWEEETVDNMAGDEYGLNMIPGGFRGNEELHKLGLIARRNASSDERESAISKLAAQNPRKGLPNLFIKQLWEDDAHYERVNQSHPGRLSGDAVREIRRLAKKGLTDPQILERTEARNLQQVKGITAGKTYKRVPD